LEKADEKEKNVKKHHGFDDETLDDDPHYEHEAQAKCGEIAYGRARKKKQKSADVPPTYYPCQKESYEKIGFKGGVLKQRKGGAEGVYRIRNCS